jgi:outer membrane protein TolC
MVRFCIAALLLSGAVTRAGAQAIPVADTGRVRTSALVGLEVDTSGTPFTFPGFVDAVLAHHPVAQQAQLVARQARAELRQAWGAFDPKHVAAFRRQRLFPLLRCGNEDSAADRCRRHARV